jgi:hypothetical protein
MVMLMLRMMMIYIVGIVIVFLLWKESIPNDPHIVAPQLTAEEDGLRRKDLE